MNLVTRHAPAIISMLEDAQDVGMSYAVWVERPMERELHPADIDFFDTYGAALTYWESRADPGYLPGYDENPVYYYRHVDQLIEDIKQANSLKNINNMNYNNLQNLQDELSKLGFGKKVADEMQKQMEKGATDFQLHDRVMGNKGQIDLTLYFKQSGQSENYYLNKYDVRLLNGKPLGEGEKFMVVNPEIKKDGKPVIRSFDLAADAISFFKTNNGDAILASGKDWTNKTDLAKMEKDNINFIQKDFQRTYRNPDVSQTFFVERGKGFTSAQAVNLIQGRAVYRDDLLKLGGEPYRAWIKLDMDSQKDRYQNFQTLQYHVPTFGFDLEKTLDKFNIKELNDEKKRDQLIRSVEQGNRPLVTVIKDDKESNLYIEVQPRYSQLNFFREDGKPEKREQFLKEPALDQKIELNKGKAQTKEQEQGLAV